MKNLFDRAKLFFCKDREFRSALYDIMGFCPHNIDLYRTAFAHKSQEYRSKKLGNKPLNNERLEFLGDAVLETVVSHIVYRHFPNKREGFLTNTRSKIVSRESLGKLAKELHIDRLIQSQTHSRTHNSYLGGNSFEALMGAIYLDRGFRYAFRFVEQRIIGAVLDLESVASKEVNFKSKLLEWSQKNRIRLEFKDSATDTDKANGPSFLTTIVIEGLYAGEGKGYSKKESHQTAAKDALTKLRREPQFLDSVFRAKEKRTAMGAEEFFTVPKIDEIEAEIAKEQSEGAPTRKDNARNERSRKEKGGEQRNDKRADRQKENREDKNTERKNTKARGEKQDEDGAKGNTERKDRKNKGAEARKEREQRRRAAERETANGESKNEAAADAPKAKTDERPRSKKNASAQEPKETPAAENNTAAPEVGTPGESATAAPQKEQPSDRSQRKEQRADAEPTAVANADAQRSELAVQANETLANEVAAPTTAPQSETAAQSEKVAQTETPMSRHDEPLPQPEPAQTLPDTPNILPQSDRIEAQGQEAMPTVQSEEPTAVFAPMQLPAAIADELKPEQPKESVTSDEPATSVAGSTDERDTSSTQEKHGASPDDNSVSPVEQPAAQEADPSVSSATDRSAEESETPAASADEAPEEAPAPRTEQQKKRARRQNKAQNAAGYTNTTPPPAEQSRRAEKAERRLREEAHRRDVERAQNDLADEAESTDTSEEESSDAQPTARRNTRRRRGGARRRKNGRNNGNAENGNADNAPQQDAAPN